MAAKGEVELFKRKKELLVMEARRQITRKATASTQMPYIGLPKDRAPFDDRRDDTHAYLL